LSKNVDLTKYNDVFTDQPSGYEIFLKVNI